MTVTAASINRHSVDGNICRIRRCHAILCVRRQVDIDAQAIGCGVHPDVALVADSGLTATTFNHWLNQAEIPASGFTTVLDTDTLIEHVPAAGQISEGFINHVYALER